jgi:hypothetical protein
MSATLVAVMPSPDLFDETAAVVVEVLDGHEAGRRPQTTEYRTEKHSVAMKTSSDISPLLGHLASPDSLRHVSPRYAVTDVRAQYKRLRPS